MKKERIENKLLLQGLCNNGRVETESISSDFDWSYFFNLCDIHKVTNIIYRKIDFPISMPRGIFRAFSNGYLIQKYRSEKQQQEFLALLDILNKSHIEFILLKGVYLAATCYDDIAERPYNDMDILIRQKDAEKVFQIFLENGYVQGEFDSSSKSIKKFDEDRLTGFTTELQHYGEFVKLGPDDFLPVYSIDVHHRLSTVFDNFAYDIDGLFERAVKEEICGVCIRRLANEDFLLHLSSHLYWHTLSLRDIISGRDVRLLMYYDIAKFVTVKQIDWEELLRRGELEGLAQPLYYCLYHTRLLFGDIIPKTVFNKVDMSRLKEISDTIYDRWFTRDTLIPVGKWTHEFMDRLFDENRKYEALLSFYNDYINKVLFSGSYFKVVDINSEERFS